MSGTYKIIQIVAHPNKFACYVKFNEQIDKDFYTAILEYPEGGEYWEYESRDPVEVAAALQSTADADAERWAAVDVAQSEPKAIKVNASGQIAL